jgi:hypothetical protein
MKHAIATILLLGFIAAEKPAYKVPKPPTVTREEWGSNPQPIGDEHKHTPKFVTIHHAGVDYKLGRDPVPFVQSVQAWGQKEKNWPDLPYHFMIAPDGRIFEARPLEYEPQSNTKYPLAGHVGVELMGNFETQRPSDAQLKSTVAISAWICQEYNIDTTQIAGHKDRAEGQTTCPGKDFYRYLQNGQFKRWVDDTLAGKDPEVKMADPLPDGPKVIINTPPSATEAATKE